MRGTDISATDKFILIKQVIYRIGVGAAGSLILVFFLVGLMSFGDAMAFMPWIIGFNAALTGYTILDKTRNRLKRKRLVVLASGVLMVGVTCLIISATGLYLTGSYLLTARDLILLPIVGIVCGGLGAWLAMKYFNLK